MKNIYSAITGLILIAVFASQCSTQNKITADDKSQLDPNFAGYDGVLLIQRNYDNKHGLNNVDKTINKSFKAYYKGEFLLIKTKDLANYSNLIKYRFLVQPGFNAPFTGYDHGVSQFSQHSNIYMLDRQTGKEYNTRQYGGYYALEKFAIAFEALRTSKKL